MRQHAEPARLISTPICLDGSVVWFGPRRRDRAPGRPGDQHQGRPGRWLPDASEFTICARPTGFRSGPAGWSSRAGRTANAALAALPGFTLQGDSRPPTASTSTTSPRRSCWTTARSPYLPGRASGWSPSRACWSTSPSRRNGSRHPDVVAGEPPSPA